VGGEQDIGSKQLLGAYCEFIPWFQAIGANENVKVCCIEDLELWSVIWNNPQARVAVSPFLPSDFD
jgi:hypothetical protein